VTPAILERMRKASAKSKEAARSEGLAIARECLAEVRELIQGVQVSAPFGNVKYALEVFDALPDFARQPPPQKGAQTAQKGAQTA
jgi:homocysteine S-methyltransferase